LANPEVFEKKQEKKDDTFFPPRIYSWKLKMRRHKRYLWPNYEVESLLIWSVAVKMSVHVTRMTYHEHKQFYLSVTVETQNSVSIKDIFLILIEIITMLPIFAQKKQVSYLVCRSKRAKKSVQEKFFKHIVGWLYTRRGRKYVEYQCVLNCWTEEYFRKSNSKRCV